MGTTYGEINGTVTDASGAIVTAATVTVTNTVTNASRTVMTSDSGRYDLPFLVPGTYNIRAERQGFKAEVRTNVDLQVSAVAQIDFTLQVGGATETVEVSGEAAALETEGTAVGTVIDNRRIEDLPLNGRTFVQMVALSPNVTAETVASGTASLRQGGERSTATTSVAGERIVFMHYTLDGVENTDPNFNTFLMRPSLDALQEFKVETGIYSAQFGRSIGQVNATTKSGGNEFHGTVFYFVRNDKLNAREWDQTLGKPNPYKQNQPGFVFGGPILKNRLFFLTNMEALTENDTEQTVASVATMRMRSGDFSQDGGRTIYDPLSRVYTNSNGNPLTVAVSPFPGNIIPQTEISPTALDLMNYAYPAPTVPGDSIVSNYVREGAHWTNWEQFTQRFDFVENPSSFWFGRFGWNDEFAQQYGTFASSEGRFMTTVYQGVLANTRILSPSMVNEARFGYSAFLNTQLTHSAYNVNVAADFGINTPAPPPAGWGVPSIALSNGLSGFGETVDGPFINHDLIFDWQDNVSYTHGAHAIRFGGEFRRDRMNQLGNAYDRGAFGFTNGDATANPTTSALSLTTGYSFADFLVGQAANYQQSAGLGNAMLRGSAFAGYVEDVWKVTPKLTVNIGLRYELTDPYHDKYRGLMTVEVPSFGVNANGIIPGAPGPVLLRPGNGPVYAGTTAQFWSEIPTATGNSYIGNGNSPIRTDFNDFAPRIGLAYSPDSKTTFRLGAGTYYAHDIVNGTYGEMARNAEGRANETANAQVPNIPINNPLVSQTSVANCPGFTGVCQTNATLAFALDPNLRTPYVNQWLANVQRQFARNLVLEVGYLGNEGHKLEWFHILNVSLPRTGPTDASTIPQRAPFPNWGTIQYTDGSVSSNYEALSSKLSQRFSSGLTYLFAFTWSHAIDYSSNIRSGGSERGQAIDSYDFALSRGNAAYDVRRRFVGSIVYELPFGAGKKLLNQRGIANVLVGGWQVGSIMTFADGIPWSVGAIGDTMNIGGSQTPNATGISAVPTNRSAQQFWNIAAFNATNPLLSYQFGNAARDDLFAPGTADVDFSLIKTTRITERQALQLRFECFNFLNHPNWNAPASTPTAPTTFGVITTAKAMREVQIALKYSF